jgi:subtilisin
LILGSIAACSDNTVVTPDAPPAGLSTRPATSPPRIEFPREKRGLDRKDTPWQRMTDGEFAAWVDSAQGRVAIGLKDLGAHEGVDNLGRVVASAAGTQAAKRSLRDLGIAVAYEFVRTPALVATVTPEQAVALRRHPHVDYIEPSIPGRLASQTTPWGVSAVGATTSWGLSTGEGVGVLILDSGVNANHDDLSVAHQYHCAGDAGWPTFETTGHGTHIAGTVAALNNDIYVVGVAHGVSLMVSNIMDSTDSRFPNPSRAACAIDYFKGYNVGVINISWQATPTTALTDQINSAWNTYGIVVVASVGNDTLGTVTYPANLSNVIGVTAVNSSNGHAGFANIGSEVDLAAPGVGVLSTSWTAGNMCTTGGHTAQCDGTSMAAAHVSGAAALLMARYPAWGNADIRARLLSTATDLGATGFDNYFGYGLVNVDKAIKMQVSIVGPTIADSGVQQTYYANISGGQGPYTFSWAVNGEFPSTNDTLFYTPDDDFNVSLYVLDQYNLGASAGPLYVTVQNCDPWCTEDLVIHAPRPGLRPVTTVSAAPVPGMTDAWFLPARRWSGWQVRGRPRRG